MMEALQQDHSYVELPSGLVITTETARQITRPKAIDVFAGAGNLELGDMKSRQFQVSAADSLSINAGYIAGSKVTINPGVNGIDRKFLDHAV